MASRGYGEAAWWVASVVMLAGCPANPPADGGSDAATDTRPAQDATVDSPAGPDAPAADALPDAPPDALPDAPATDGGDAALPGDASDGGPTAVPHEVWVVDQSDTTDDGGGALYIYDGADLAGPGAATATARATRIDLGGATRALCMTATGTAPRRPHMLLFNAGFTHAALAFVATGHIVVFDARTRAPVACVDVGLQAHAAYPTADSRYLVVANQNGKLLQRIRTDYATNTFALENDATLNLATCTTPSGAACQDPALRPDNAPICPIVEAGGRYGFVTLRGGGLLVVDVTATPMAIVAEYDRATVAPNGCGGVETAGRMFINSGGGTAATPLRSTLYAFTVADFRPTPAPVNTPAPRMVFNYDGFHDSHGAALVPGTRFLWVADRASNEIVVVDGAASSVTRTFTLAGGASTDPAPDLMDADPSGARVYVALRGLRPLTANAPGVDNAVGSTPGVGVIDVREGGANGALRAVAPITNVVAGDGGAIETADPHGIAVRPLPTR